MPPAPAPKRIASHIEFSPAPSMGTAVQGGQDKGRSAGETAEGAEHAMSEMSLSEKEAASGSKPTAQSGEGKAVPALDLSEFDPFGTPSHSNTRAPAAKVGRPAGPSGLSQSSAPTDTDRSGSPPPIPPKTTSPRTPEQAGTSSRAERSLHQVEVQAASASAQARADDRYRDSQPSSADAESGQTRQGETQEPARRDKEKEEPAFNFSGFLRDLRTKPAEPIARYLKR